MIEAITVRPHTTRNVKTLAKKYGPSRNMNLYKIIKRSRNKIKEDKIKFIFNCIYCCKR